MAENNGVIVTQQAGVITCNFVTVKAYLDGVLEEYRGAVFTEESKTYAKKLVASLRSDKKALLDKLKEVKAEFMEPYNAFEAQVKELAGMYDEPINFINDQVTAFEEKRREEKRALIAEIYEADMSALGEDVREYLPLEKIYDSRWENATCKKKEIEQDIIVKIGSTKQAVECISAMNSDAVPEALKRYKNDFDLAAAMAYVNNYERQKVEILKKEEERKRQEEIERVRREEREKLLAEQRAQEEKERALRLAEEEKQRAVEEAKAQAAQEVIDSLIPEENGEDSSFYSYTMFMTPSEKEKLELYMNSVGIDWEENE